MIYQERRERTIENMEQFTGRVWVLGDDIDTDIIKIGRAHV